MTIDEAIKILIKWKAECSYDDTERLNEAEQLGIEALQRITACRQPEGYKGIPELPGETKD